MLRAGRGGCMVEGMTFSLKQLARAIPVAAVLLPGDALAEGNAACPGGDATGGPYYDPCADIDGWTEVTLMSAGPIPADGVLVLQGEWRGAQPEPETVVLTVSVDDVPLAGSVEASDLFGVLVWRPDTAWTPGATYTITGTATNAEGDGDCVQPSLPIAGEVTIDEQPGEPLVPVDVDAVQMLTMVPTVSLETLACCAGASPSINDGNCDGNDSVDFEPGQCAPVSGIGFMQLTITGTPAAGAAKEQQVLYVLSGDGLIKEFGFAPMFGASQLTAPQCVAIDAIDLGTGEVVVGAPECFGEDVKAQLGPQALDPEASLDCAPQVCAVDQGGFQWDLEMCAPYSGGGETPTEGGGSGTDEESGEGGGDAGGQDGEKGCGCDVRGGGSPWLVVLGLGWIGRRRRCG